MEEETLIQEIMQNAEQEVRNIMTKAHEEAKDQIIQDKKDIEKEERRKLQEVKRQIEQESSNKKDMAELQARNKILAQKQKAIKEIKQNVLQKIQNSDKQEYVRIISQMLNNAKVNNTSEYEIILPKKEKDEIESIAKLKGYRISSQQADFVTGFILKKGRVEQNYVLETWLDFNKEEIDELISEVLFRRD